MKSVKKIFTLFLTFIIAAAALAGCTPDTPDPGRGGKLSIGAMNGPTMIGLAKLDADAKAGLTANDYTVTKEATPDLMTAGLIAKKYDAAALPCNNAAILFNSKALDIQVAAVNTLNVLYLVANTDNIVINNLADLAGKTVYLPGLGGTPEYVFRYLLAKNNVRDVNLQFKTEGAEIVQGLKAGLMDIAVLPQPAAAGATTGSQTIKIQLDLAEEWKKVPGNEDKPIITGVLAVRKAYLKNNKAAFDKFLDEYKASAEYMGAAANLDTAAGFVVDLGIIASVAVAKEALPCGVTFIGGEEMKDKVSAFLTVLYSQNKDAVGGKIPGAGFYYLR